MYNSNSKIIKTAEIWVSVKNNKIKLTFYDSLLIQNTLDNLMTLLLNKKTENKEKELFSLTIDFNNSNIIFNAKEKCEFYTCPFLEGLGAKFILVSYDLFVYFNNDTPLDNNYYDYIFTNPDAVYLTKFLLVLIYVLIVPKK